MAATTNDLLSPLIWMVVATGLALSTPLEAGQAALGMLSKTASPELQAERMIRQLNLFPRRRPLNQRAAGPMAAGLVENKVKLAGLMIQGDPGTPVQDLGHHAGYYRLPHAKDARMFYFFFESRGNKKRDPVVIWLTGGPGCSSELALFYENGPFHFSIANSSLSLNLSWNDFGWDKVSNLIYVDQPTGTGFSYTTDDDDIRHDESGVSNDLYDFLQGFFKEHPEYVNNDFYITGESYAGHYIPAFAARVHQGNKAQQGIHINLKGFAIGNGLTNPAIQYSSYADYAMDNGLIQDANHRQIMTQMVPNCEKAIQLCGTNSSDNSCSLAYIVCTNIFNKVMSIAGNDLNYYDIRKKCNTDLCYDFSQMEQLLNKKPVREALGVGNIDFVSCSSAVYTAMEDDWMKNLETGIPELLEDGINLLVYAGEYDLICNWLGNSRWVQAMEWSGQEAFASAPTVSFQVDGSEAGQLQSHASLAFLKVHDAGHMVPMDQPKASLEMLRRWTRGELYAKETR